jgi:hypothetical protein
LRGGFIKIKKKESDKKGAKIKKFFIKMRIEPFEFAKLCAIIR